MHGPVEGFGTKYAIWDYDMDNELSVWVLNVTVEERTYLLPAEQELHLGRHGE